VNASDIKRYSAADLARRRAHGGSHTDLARVRAKTAVELTRMNAVLRAFVQQARERRA
jgi:hypothetical protein